MDIWHELGIDATQDLKQIKKAYASQLKSKRPDQDPQAYQQLREAYEQARAYASCTQNAAAPEPAGQYQTVQAQVELLLQEVFNQPTQMAQAQALTAKLEGESNLFIRAEVEEALFDIGFAWPDEIQFPAYLYRRAADIYHWVIPTWPGLDLEDPMQRLLMRMQFEYEFRQAQSQSVSLLMSDLLFSTHSRSVFLMHRKCSPILLYLCGFSGFGAKEIKTFIQRLNQLYPLEKSSTFTTKAVLWWAKFFNNTSRLLLKHHVFAFVTGFICSSFYFVGGAAFLMMYLASLLLVSLYLKIRKK